MRLRIVTWNINSIRVRLGNLARLVREIAPDIICLQETKVQDRHFPAAAVAELGYPHVMIRGMKGYNGVAILSRVALEPLAAPDWCGRDDARHVAARLALDPNGGNGGGIGGGKGGGIEIHNLYVPAGGDVPDAAVNDKFAHKLRFLDEVTAWFGARKRRGARLVLAGDLNVAPLETDVWSHERLLGVVTHTPVEVARLERLMAALAWTDAVRHFIPPPQRLYSWWSYRARDWAERDRGRRLDHLWVTKDLVPALESAQVMRAARGWDRPSDHVPVCLTLDTAG